MRSRSSESTTTTQDLSRCASWWPSADKAQGFWIKPSIHAEQRRETMNQSVQDAMLSETDLFQVRSLIEERSGMVFDLSRARFFTNRVREYLEQKGMARAAELMRRIKASN